eukprot:COSAG02_NODE_5873_length_3972_cov_20.899045_8_plen_206_part_00
MLQHAAVPSTWFRASAVPPTASLQSLNATGNFDEADGTESLSYKLGIECTSAGLYLKGIIVQNHIHDSVDSASTRLPGRWLWLAGCDFVSKTTGRRHVACSLCVSASPRYHHTAVRNRGRLVTRVGDQSVSQRGRRLVGGAEVRRAARGGRLSRRWHAPGWLRCRQGARDGLKITHVCAQGRRRTRNGAWTTRRRLGDGQLHGWH